MAEADGIGILFCDERNYWHVVDARPWIAPAPAGIAAQLQAQTGLALPATGHSGCAIVPTGKGEAFLIDAGRDARMQPAVFRFQVAGMMAAAGVRAIDSIAITHSHVDHINEIKDFVLAKGIPAARVQIEDFQANASRAWLRAWAELAADPRGQALGYGIVQPGRDGFRRALDPSARYLRARAENGEVVVEYRARADAAQQLAANPGAAAALKDSAASILELRRTGTNFRVIHVGDVRGRDIEALAKAMDAQRPGSFEEMFRGTELVSGMQHHLGAVAPGDVPGIVRMLEVTALGGTGRLEAMVQTSDAQMRPRLVEALSWMGVDVTAALQGDGDTLAGISVRLDGTLAVSGDAVLRGREEFASQYEDGRQVRRRLADLETLRLALSLYDDAELLRMGITLPMARGAALAAVTDTLSEVRAAYARRGALVLEAVAGQQNFNVGAIRATTAGILRERAVDQALTPGEVAERLREIGRLDANRSAIDLEARLAELGGGPSQRLLELIETVSPGWARELMEPVPREAYAREQMWRELLVQEQQLKILHAEVPATGGSAMLVGALAITEVANHFLHDVGELRELRESARLDALQTWLWWENRGMAPPVSGDPGGGAPLTREELVAGLKANADFVRKDLRALTVGPIEDPAQWLRFGFWCAAHVLNFDDYCRNFVDVPMVSVRPMGTGDLSQAQWELRTWYSEAGFFGGQQFAWKSNGGLTRVMAATLQRVRANTQAALDAFWAGREQPASSSPPMLTAPGDLSSRPLGLAGLRPLHRLAFKDDAVDRALYDGAGNVRRSAWDAQAAPRFYEVSVPNTPAGKLAVVGADYDTYRQVRLAGRAAVAFVDAGSITRTDLPAPNPLLDALVRPIQLRPVPQPLVHPSGGSTDDIAVFPPRLR